MTVSLRSALSAGLAAGLAATATCAVVSAPALAPRLPVVVSPAVELSAAVTANIGGATTSPGDALINAYYVVQPWVQYGFEVAAWAASWLPWPIGLLGPQVNIAYSGIQPLSEAVVFSLAYLIDGQFDLVLPTLTAGIQTAVNNVVQGEIAWITSFFPPLPPLPFPVLPGAAVAAGQAPAAARHAAAAARVRGVAPVASTAVETSNTPAESNPAAPAAVGTPAPVAVPPARRSASRAAVRAARAESAAAAARPAAATPSKPEAAPDAGTPATNGSNADGPRSAHRGARTAR